MTGIVSEVTFHSFEQIVDSNPLVVLDFWAPWCGPCRIFAPVFEKMAEIYPDVFFGKVNTEEAPDLAQAFQVRSIPTLMAFQRGELVFEQAGLLSPQQFDALIARLRATTETAGS